MGHERYYEAIQELADGTLGAIRRADLQQHLDQCEDCRRVADDLVRVRELAASLEHPAPPDRVWLHVAGRLRQEGRIAAPAPSRAASTARRLAPLALAASLILIIGASLFLLYPRGDAVPAQQASGNAAPTDVVEGIEADLRKADELYKNAFARLEEAGIDAETVAMLKANHQAVDQAVAESLSAVRSDPQSTAARQSLFGALNRRVVLLQDTIALMNRIRKGDAAGAAEIVEGANKS
jgi:hypothetical protein